MWQDLRGVTWLTPGKSRERGWSRAGEGKKGTRILCQVQQEDWGALHRRVMWSGLNFPRLALTAKWRELVQDQVGTGSPGCPVGHLKVVAVTER